MEWARMLLNIQSTHAISHNTSALGVCCVHISTILYICAGWGAIGICALPFRIKSKMSKQTLHTRVITISLRHFPVAEESWKFANILAMPAGHISKEIGN